MSEPDDELQRLRAFASEIMERAWNGYDTEPNDAEHFAIKHKIIVEVPYNPDKHGPNDVELKPGDPWYQVIWSIP